jgi:hypothetical protein
MFINFESKGRNNIMKTIRTTTVELASAPAIAFRQRLKAGGAGLRIINLENGASAAYTVDRRTGGAVAYGASHDANFFTAALIEEALLATQGLPFSKRGSVSAVGRAAVTAESEAEIAAEAVCEADLCSAEQTQDPEKIDMYDSVEYRNIILEYMDLSGKLNYQRLNKDFIQFATKSKKVNKMISDKAPVEQIIIFVVASRAASLAGKKETLTDCEVKALIATIDDMNPRSAFKELSAHLKRMAKK